MIRFSLIFLAALVIASGCTLPAGERAGSGWQFLTDEIEQSSHALAKSWRNLSNPQAVEIPAQWKWVTGIPQNATRADGIETATSEAALAALAPQLIGEVRLANGTPQQYFVTEVGGKKVRNLAQMYAAVEQGLQQDEPGQIAVVSGATGRQSTATVNGLTLLNLLQATAESAEAVSLADDGNPWLVLRRGGVRCKLMTRVERQTGLLHVLMGTKVCWGPPQLLPADTRASCNGTPMMCLTASQALAVLYGHKSDSAVRLRKGSASFGETSEREDYLLPTNFKDLEVRMLEAAKRGVTPPPLPALATLQGIAYPGSAVLGDARALGFFLARRTICHPDEPERIGWMIFQSEELKKAKNVNLDIDLGNSLIPLVFELPDSP